MRLPIVPTFDYEPDYVNRPVHIPATLFWQNHTDGEEEVIVTVDKNIDLDYETLHRAVELHLTFVQQMYFGSLPTIFVMNNGELSFEVNSCQ
jgi:hypothetical protein